MSIQENSKVNVNDVILLCDALAKSDSSEIKSKYQENGRQIATWLETLASPGALPETDAKEITQLFMNRVNPEFYPRLEGNVYNRWVFTNSIEHGDSEFGKHYVAQHPESPVVLNAIADVLIEHLVSSLSHAYYLGDNERAQLIYSILPQKIKNRMEANIYKYKKLELDGPDLKDPEFGKHYIETCFKTRSFYSSFLAKIITETRIKPQLIPAEELLNYDPRVEDARVCLKLTPSFFQRVWKVGTECGVGMEAFQDLLKDPMCGEKIFFTLPECKIAQIAVLEELMWNLTKLIPEFISKGDFEKAKLIYDTLKQHPGATIMGLDEEMHPITSLIDEKVWEVWSSQTKEPTTDKEFGKHYLEKYFEGKKDDPIVNKAFELFFKDAGLNPEPNPDRYYNENIKGLFYEIKDPEGKVRGYLLGTIHLARVECNKIRHLVWNRFMKCNVVSPEVDITTEFNEKEYKKLKETTKVGFLEADLLYHAHSRNIKVEPLEKLEDQKKLLNETLEEKLGNGAYLFERDANKLTEAEKASRYVHQLICQVWANGNEAEATQLCTELIANDIQTPEGLKFWKASQQRNPAMADKADAMLNDPTLLPFFKVGYSHVLDLDITGDGLPTLLRQKGWTVNQI